MNQKKSKYEYKKIRYDEIKTGVWQVVVELKGTPRDGIVDFPFGITFAFPSRAAAKAAMLHFIEEVEKVPLSYRNRTKDRLYLDEMEKAYVRNGGTKEDFKGARKELLEIWREERKR